ncbi:MAB_1171c family putative transporter [Streptomyces erythrochromogenes]|uniref:MAB_1171c family putative transporter n=1 Tax=Streptomyces erythrochromogenes TaxID=285574 RepID=UPI0034487BBB
MTAGSLYLTSAGVLFAATLIKLWALKKNPGDVLLRAVCAVLFVAALLFVTAAPPMLALINAWTGVPNGAAPVVYGILTAFDGASIVLLIHWRGDEDANRTRRATRLCLTVYGMVMVAIVVLFVLGDAPVERLRDLDTYYASTPFIREMIVLYLAAHTVAAVTMLVLCWRWSRQVPGALRVGLLFMAAGNTLTFGYDLLKYTAIVARWAGRNLDWLSTQVAFSMASISAFLVAAGFLIPPIGQGATSRWKAFQRFQQLKPLWVEIRPEIPPTSPPPMSWWAPMELRLMQRERDIHDAVLRLGPFFDGATGQRVYEQALARNREHRIALSEADAAVIAGAVIAKGTARTSPLDPEDRWTVSSAENSEDLVSMSSALVSSPLVRATRASTDLADLPA